jgi:hypothetical protein
MGVLSTGDDHSAVQAAWPMRTCALAARVA